MNNVRKHIFKKLSGERVFALTDVHGQLSLLIELLNKVNFDENKDKLITIGDTINRGTHSYETFDMLSKVKNVTHIMGNHELSLIRAFDKHWGSFDSKGIDTGKNEEWQNKVPIEALRKTIKRYTKNAAYAGTILLDNGTTFGICHGDPVYERWEPEAIANLGKDKLKAMICNRARFTKLNPNQYQGYIDGVDWTLHGHTVNEEITVFKNSIYLDVGAGSTTKHKKLAILDLNKFSETKCVKSASETVHQ